MGRSDDQWRKRGRPPLPQFTLTAPKYTPAQPGQRKEAVAILAELILNEYYRKWRAERGITEPLDSETDPQQGEDAGKSPAP